MIRAGLVVGLLSTTALSPTAQAFAFVLGLALLAMLGAVLFVHSDRPVERLLALVAAVRRPSPAGTSFIPDGGRLAGGGSVMAQAVTCCGEKCCPNCACTRGEPCDCPDCPCSR